MGGPGACSGPGRGAAEQAWRGVCALRWRSLRDCSKAAERSAAVPLPVEAAAAAEDAHWRSWRSPRRHRPRPRSAPRSFSASTRQAPHLGGSLLTVRPRPGREDRETLRLCEAFSNPSVPHSVPAALQPLQLCTAGRATSACSVPEPGSPTDGGPAAPTELCSELPGECKLRHLAGVPFKAYCFQ